MANRLDRKYLEDHWRGVHTLESFGASVVDLAMRTAMEQVGDAGSAEFLEFNLPVRVEPLTIQRRGGFDTAAAPGTIDCLSIGIGIPPFVISIHYVV
jgi:hypothetical protein